jgi:hypothetical protein
MDKIQILDLVSCIALAVKQRGFLPTSCHVERLNNAPQVGSSSVQVSAPNSPRHGKAKSAVGRLSVWTRRAQRSITREVLRDTPFSAEFLG